MQKLITDNLLEISKKYTASRLYLYGSSACYLSKEQFRDIDALIITTNKQEIDLFSFKIQDVQCNLYSVPYKVFLQDLLLNKYGGYYSQKFALNFRLIANNGMKENPAEDFWHFYFYKFWNHELFTKDPASLCRLTHKEIYKYRPTFGRPLSKWLSNRIRIEQLYEELSNTDFTRTKSFSLPTQANPKEESLFLFWREYDRHKNTDNQHLWSFNSTKKMILSLNACDIELITTYLK